MKIIRYSTPAVFFACSMWRKIGSKFIHFNLSDEIVNRPGYSSKAASRIL